MFLGKIFDNCTHSTVISKVDAQDSTSSWTNLWRLVTYKLIGSSLCLRSQTGSKTIILMCWFSQTFCLRSLLSMRLLKSCDSFLVLGKPKGLRNWSVLSYLFFSQKSFKYTLLYEILHWMKSEANIIFL